MNESIIYDVVVIGSGPGGYVSAIRAAQLGLKTAVVEKQWLGGVCLNLGCVPSKALLKNAELVYTLCERSTEFGLSFDNLKLDYSVAVSRSRQVSKRLTLGVSSLMKKNKIDVHMGTAKIVAKNKISITNADNQIQELIVKNIIVATGAYSMSIPGVTIDGERILSYAEAILQTTCPENVIIIGGGAIGVEFATIWSSYGSKVTIIEMMPHILPNEDEELAKELTKIYTKRGVQILTGTQVLSIDRKETGIMVRVSADGVERVLEADQALVAIGFIPNTANIGLEAVGIKLSQRGFIEIDEHMATNVPGIWAIGDVTGKLLLAHVASAQGIVCAESIAGIKTEKLDYRMMPRAVYSNPQVASFGITETQAKEQGQIVKIGRFPFQANGKALGLGDYAGFVKIITDAKYGELLGAQIIGPDVSELLPELTLAQRNELTISEISRNIHAHPTISEAIMEAAHVAVGKSINV